LRVRILVLNPGSATLKATVVIPPDRTPAYDRTTTWDAGTIDETLAALAESAVRESGGRLDAVGYRVVHGGRRFTDAVLLDDSAVGAIEALADLAPLHNPVAARTIRAGRRLLPTVPHVACFDTAFHATLPEAAVRYPVPDDWWRDGVRRYGFHGLSVDWSTRRAAELLDRPAAGLRLVVAHLGGGCSVTAVDGGRSVDTSMGMTPLEGLMMGRRAGSIDPGIVLRLIRGGRSADAVEEDLDRRSGLAAIGGTADMADLLRREPDDARASLAIEMFVRRAAAAVAAAATALPALDAIVFTGGIGEHAAPIRDRIVARLRLTGGATTDWEVEGDAVRRSEIGPAVLRVRAREDLVIAAEVDAIGRTTAS
jgi:acetate kinase